MGKLVRLGCENPLKSSFSGWKKRKYECIWEDSKLLISYFDHCTDDKFNFFSFVRVEIEVEASQMLGTKSTTEINPKSTTDINPGSMLNLNKGLYGIKK